MKLPPLEYRRARSPDEAVALLAEAGDEAKLAEAQVRWKRNADEIAAVLASVDPRPLAARRDEGRDEPAPGA